jgi:hypothetical protein
MGFKKLPREAYLDTMKRYVTQSLFLETAYSLDAIFTYAQEDKEYNGKLFYSLKKLYLECADVTEYEFANAYLADFDHWKKMCGNALIRVHIDKWREELELKLQADGLRKMMASAESGNYQAAKYLADKGWASSGKGRPTKAEKEGALKRATENDSETQAESARVLSLVKGG